MGLPIGFAPIPVGRLEKMGFDTASRKVCPHKKSQIVTSDLASPGAYVLCYFYYTHPVGLGSPAHLHAEFAGPCGKSSYISFRLTPVSLVNLRTIGAIPFCLK